jgi:hypothetical protein
MTDLVPLVLLAVGLLAVLGGCTWLAVASRRRGAAGSAISAAMAAYDEALKVTSYEAHVEIQAQARRRTPLLSPDKAWRPPPRPTGRLGTAVPRSARPRPRHGLLGRLRRHTVRRVRTR